MKSIKKQLARYDKLIAKFESVKVADMSSMIHHLKQKRDNVAMKTGTQKQ